MSSVLLVETLFLLGLATFAIYDGIRLKSIPLLVYDPIGPGWYLLIISSMLFLSSLCYFLINVKQKLPVEKHKLSLHFGPVSQLLLLLVLYTAAVPIVGYTLGTIFFFVFSLRIYGAKWTWSLLISLAFSAGFLLCFSVFAKIPLP